MFQSEFYAHREEVIKIVGIGGGGCNAVNYMHQQGIQGVQFFICNTDAQSLESSQIENKIHIGPELTRGLGAGSNPEVGRQATIESEEYIKSILSKNTKMVFVTAGMGGGTGTGGAPIIAKIAKELGILTIGIVNTPFKLEGRKRMQQAEEGIENLKNYVDTLLIISNEKLKSMYQDLSMKNAFNKANDILLNSAKCITDVVNTTGSINVDFADVCTVMRNGGVAIFGNAQAAGKNRADKAILNAIHSPLLDSNNISGAKWILLNISSPQGDNEVTMQEIDVIQNVLIKHVGENSNIILGTSYNPSYENQIGITLIATAFDKNAASIIIPYETKKDITEIPYLHTEISDENEQNEMCNKITMESNSSVSLYTQAILFNENDAQEVNNEQLTVVLSEELQNSIINKQATPNSIDLGFSLKKPQTIYQSTHHKKEATCYSNNDENEGHQVSSISIEDGGNEEYSLIIKNTEEYKYETKEESRGENKNAYSSTESAMTKEDNIVFEIKEIEEENYTKNNGEVTTYTQASEESNLPTNDFQEDQQANPFLAEEDKSWDTIPQHNDLQMGKEVINVQKKLSSFSIGPTKINKKVLSNQPSYLRNETINRYIENSHGFGGNATHTASHYKVEGDSEVYSKINAVNQFLFGQKPD